MSSHPTRSTPPLGVKLLAALVTFDAGLFLVEALRAFGAGAPEVAFLMAGLGVLQLIVAVGLWMLEPYAWGAAMFVLGVIFVVEVAVGAHVGALLSGAIALYLYTQKETFET